MSLTPNQPIVNAGLLYVNNLQYSYNAARKIDIAAGAARDSTDTTDIVLSSAAILNAAVTGANGLDTGTITLNSWYYLYLIGSSGSLQPTATLLSLSATAPTLPFQYDSFRRIGVVLTDASSNFAHWVVLGNGATRNYFWDTTALIYNSTGTADTFTALSLSGALPTVSQLVYINWQLVPTTAANALSFRPTGGTATAPWLFVTAPVASKASTGQIVMNTSALQSIDYKTSQNTDELQIYVTGFVDYL